MTIGDATYALDPLFVVLATQNPIEQEGTYPLPEAQVDRFMLKLKVTYPSRREEREIMDRYATAPPPQVNPVVTPQVILRARELVGEVYVDEKIKDYVLDLVFATREPGDNGLIDLDPLIEFGASPRASIYLIMAARAHAFLQGRGFVIIDHGNDAFQCQCFSLMWLLGKESIQDLLCVWHTTTSQLLCCPIE